MLRFENTITDFGISRAAGDGQTDGGTRAGKSGYLAPERIRGEGATSSSDLFAAGVISVELLLGRRLFEGDGPEETLDRIRRFDARTLPLPGVSPGLEGVLRKCIAALPGDRYPGAAEFLVDLARVGPPPASGPVMADFWDALFPAPREEETAPDPAAEPGSRPAMVKEPEERYGGRGRTVQVGAAAVFAAVVVGGILLWKEVPQRPAIDAAPASVVPLVPAVPPPSVAPAVPGAVPAAVPSKRESPLRESPSPVTQRTPNPPAIPGMPVARLVRVETDPPGASVLLESGASLGKTPLQMEVASLAGRKVVLSKDGYEPQAVPADALAAGPEFRAELQPLIGTVEAIQAIPWAKVYLGSRLLGETPLTAVRLPAGEQRLRFVNEPLGVDQVKIIVVRPGGNPKIIVPMTGSDRR